MSDRPTFSLVSDWAALADIDHITFRIYAIICTNAEFGRNGLTTHTLHVTASWVVDATKHWEKPLGLSTVRKHMQKLVEAGVLMRVNNPNEGMGTIYAIVADPGEAYEGPVNGFAHAKKISRRKNTTSVYRRIPLDGAVAGPKEKPKKVAKSDEPTPFEDDVILPELTEEFFEGEGEGEGGEPDPFDILESQFQEPEPKPEAETNSRSDLSPKVAQFASALEIVTARHSEERLHLMPGACRRIAVAMEPILARGWEPDALAKRLSSELNSKIHSPEQLLISKVADLGDPPPGHRSDGKVRMGGQIVDPGAIDLGFGHDGDLDEGPTKTSPHARRRGEGTSDRLARLARKISR